MYCLFDAKLLHLEDVLIPSFWFKQNKEVVTEITLPNVLLNALHGGAQLPLADETGCSFLQVSPASFQGLHSRLFAGDWGTLQDVVGAEKYDVVLTSETIYSVSSYAKLIALFQSLLKFPTGVA